MGVVVGQVLVLVGSVLLLWKGSVWLVDSLGRIGRTVGLSETATGLFLVAFATSSPELAVTGMAALSGAPDISVGNVVGSNIFNLGIILGACAAIGAMGTKRGLVYRDGLTLIGVSVVLMVFLLDHHLARWEGLALLGGLVVWLGWLLLRREVPDEEVPEGRAGWWDWGVAALALAAVLGGAQLLVSAASTLAAMAGVSEWVIAVTVVAAGTSAPEMATALAAALKGRAGMTMGNLIGSDLFNMLGVLGLAGAMRPMTVSPESLSSVVMLVGMCVLVVAFMRTGWVLSRWEGAALVAVALGRWVLDLAG